MFNKTLHEILSTKVWMMQRDAFLNYHRILSKNIDAHLSLDEIELPQRSENFKMFVRDGVFVMESLEGDAGLEEKRTSSKVSEGGADIDESNDYVLVLSVNGPVTRGGGLCTYGSIDHRDMLLNAANDEDCKGVVFCIDTPGGSAFSLHDYKQGLDAIKQAGKRSISFIDGMCCSAGVALACQTDYITVYNPADEIGCIGAMMAGWMPESGATADGYRYIDVTASQTPDKNVEYRLASVGDCDMLQEEVDRCAQEFLDLIEEQRPQILPEQRTGKVYRASSVMGTLVDGVSSFNDCVDYVLTGNIDLAISMEGNDGGSDDDIEEPEKDPSVPVDIPGDDTEDDPEESHDDEIDEPQEENNPNNDNDMKQFHAIPSLIGEEVFEADVKGGLYLQAEQAESLENILASVKKQEADAEELEHAKAELENAGKNLEDACAEKDATLEKVKEMEQQLSLLQQQVSQLTEQNEKLSSEITEVKDVNVSLAETNKDMEDKLKMAEQTIEDQKSEIEDLNNSASQSPDAGEAPAKNGASASAPTLKVHAPGYNPSLTPAENNRIRKQYEEELKRMAYGR